MYIAKPGDIVYIKSPDVYAGCMGCVLERLPGRDGRKLGNLTVYVDGLGVVVRGDSGLIYASDDVIDRLGYIHPGIALSNFYRSGLMAGLNAAVITDEELAIRYADKIAAVDAIVDKFDGKDFDYKGLRECLL